MFDPIAQAQTPSALRNLISAASRMDEKAFGIVIKVQGNNVLNWMYADVSELRSIASLHGVIRFRQADNLRFKHSLRELTLSLSEKTPFLALMLRYEKKSGEPSSWEFVDLDFLRNLSA